MTLKDSMSVFYFSDAWLLAVSRPGVWTWICLSSFSRNLNSYLQQTTLNSNSPQRFAWVIRAMAQVGERAASRSLNLRTELHLHTERNLRPQKPSCQAQSAGQEGWVWLGFGAPSPARLPAPSPELPTPEQGNSRVSNYSTMWLEKSTHFEVRKTWVQILHWVMQIWESSSTPLKLSFIVGKMGGITPSLHWVGVRRM